jgi:regulator of protease activity HflC (stomatin/prohibitin superfamily)
VPFIDRIAKVVLLKEQVIDFRPQAVITKDNVTMHIDTVVYFQVTDPKLYTYGVDHPMAAIETLTATTMRNLIGEMELDETLTSRDVINDSLRSTLDEATDAWGIKISRLELKNIIPPREIQDAMERQMKAERERRESILRAEGEKKSAVLRAEGKKESAILTAQAEREAAILSAEGKKLTNILVAEGEAEAMIKLQSAQAEGIKKINEASPSAGTLALKSMETWAKVADGKATKIIMPTNLQDMAGMTTTFKEFMTDSNIPKADEKVAAAATEAAPTGLTGSARVAHKIAENQEAQAARGLGKLEKYFGHKNATPTPTDGADGVE